MNQQSGSRFSSNNSNAQPSYYSAPSQPGFPQDQYNFNNASASPSNSNTSDGVIKQPLFSINHSQGYQPNIPGASTFEVLLARYSPQERTRIKTENTQKYNLSPESVLYKFPPVFYFNITNKYPADFPTTMLQDMKSQIRVIRRDQQTYNKLFFGGLLYWVLLRRRAWFQLTGNGFMRLGFMLFSFNHVMQKKMEQSDLITKSVFTNHQLYQNVINKYNIAPPTKFEL